MSDPERCRFCPLANTERACLPFVSRHRRLCELLDPSHPLHHPGYVEIAAQGEDFPPPDLPRQPPPAPRLLTSEEMELQRAAEGCPHRDCTGCGCRGCRCGPAGRRAGELVSILDCLACVSAD